MKIIEYMRKTLLFVLLLSATIAMAQPHITISNPATWSSSALASYVGQTVIFDSPMYICSNRSGYTVAPRRIFSPTNQARPSTAEYNNILTLNSSGLMSISGISGYHRMGEKIYNLQAKVNSTGSITFQGGDWVGNTRADILQGPDTTDLYFRGKPTLLVCGMNLEYYIVESFDGTYGPANNAQHQLQRAKVSQALALINADIYGLVEVQQGPNALAEIASDLTANTGRNYAYITLTASPSGTYTQSAYVYCTETVTPVGQIQKNNTGVDNRKAMQLFRENATGETFIYSINHFKAKSGTGTGANANAGDGQGSFNAARVQEAQSVLSKYRSFRSQAQDQDILVMGDLNAYAKEDPIIEFLNGGMTDLHRYFHADSSYSYVYSSQAGYLDQAICNATMLPQITGMCGFHINSDERDSYTYDGYENDGSIFRCSDHDPVLVGLRLGTASAADNTKIIIGSGPSYYRVFDINGTLIGSGTLDDYSLSDIYADMVQGRIYIIQIFTHDSDGHGTGSVYKYIKQ